MKKGLQRVVRKIKLSEEEEDKEKEKEKEVDSEDDQDDDNVSSMRRELRSKSQHDHVKTISTNRFQVEKPIDNFADLTGDFVVKSFMGIF